MESERMPIPALITLGLFLSGFLACAGKQESPRTGELAGTIIPRLYFQSRIDDEAYSFRAPRDMTIDSEGALYIFDYSDYVIKKFGPNGQHIETFGGEGDEPGKFTHLTNIRALSDRLLAADSMALDIFSLQGEFVGRTVFPQEVLVDHPAILDDGSFAGSQIVAEELKKVLTYRSPAGVELARLASYNINEFFPEIREGEDFFLSEAHARQYTYAVEVSGAIVWAASDDFRIYRFREGVSREVLAETFTPAALPEEERLALEERKAKTGPPLFLYVPADYQLIHHLLAGPDGDIWVYLKSRERTGFLRYSGRGRFRGFYVIEAPFDMINPDLVVRIFNGRMYFFISERRKPLAIYAAELPERP